MKIGRKIKRSKVKRSKVKRSRVKRSKVKRSKVKRSRVKRSKVKRSRVKGSKVKKSKVKISHKRKMEGGGGVELIPSTVVLIGPRGRSEEIRYWTGDFAELGIKFEDTGSDAAEEEEEPRRLCHVKEVDPINKSAREAGINIGDYLLSVGVEWPDVGRLRSAGRWDEDVTDIFTKQDIKHMINKALDEATSGLIGVLVKPLITLTFGKHLFPNDTCTSKLESLRDKLESLKPYAVGKSVKLVLDKYNDKIPKGTIGKILKETYDGRRVTFPELTDGGNTPSGIYGIEDLVPV
jgi:hypothetical protein